MTKIGNVNFTFILMFTLNYLPYVIFGGKFSVFSGLFCVVFCRPILVRKGGVAKNLETGEI